MTNLFFYIVFCVLLLCLHQGISIKCRPGNTQTGAQFKGVLKNCKRRHTGLNINDSEDSVITEDNNSESYSADEINAYDKNFFNQGDRSLYNQSSVNRRYRESNKNNVNTYLSNEPNNGNDKDLKNNENAHKINDHALWNTEKFRGNGFSNRDTRNDDIHYNNSYDLQQNVNQMGFPQQDLVISVLSQGIEDLELKDFIEESIVECFRFLELKRDGRCEFSQNLVTCIAEKGKEKCDDWES